MTVKEECVCKAGGSGSEGDKETRSEKMRKTATTSELSCQRGNIAVTFYYRHAKSVAPLTARPRYKIQTLEIGNA
jgi:hypothetical protein